MRLTETSIPDSSLAIIHLRQVLQDVFNRAKTLHAMHKRVCRLRSYHGAAMAAVRLVTTICSA